MKNMPAGKGDLCYSEYSLIHATPFRRKAEGKAAEEILLVHDLVKVNDSRSFSTNIF